MGFWKKDKLFVIPLLAVIILGTLFRLYAGVSFPLNFDELIQYELIAKFDLAWILDYIENNDHQRALQYLIIYPFIKSGHESHFWLRLPSFLFSTISLFFFFLHCKRTISPKLALWGSALFSLNYLFLFHSFSMRPYALTIMLATMGQFLMGLLKERKNSLSLYVSFLGTLILLFNSHYYGSILAFFYFFWFYYDLNRTNPVMKKYPWPHYLGGAFFVLYLMSFGIEVISFPIPDHANHHFPGLQKITFSFIYLFSGTLSLLIGLYVFIVKGLWKKALDLRDLEALSIILGIPLCSLFVSYVYHPAFEFRFFVLLLPWAIWLVLRHLVFFKPLLKTTLLFLILVESYLVSFLWKKIDDPESRLNIPHVIKERPVLREKKTLICGNCPLYYMRAIYQHCVEGYNFDLLPEHYSWDDTYAFLVFKENRVFCDRYIPKDWKRTDYMDVEVYERP